MGVYVSVAHQMRTFGFRSTLNHIVPSTDYLTHDIHPYTAKLIPHIPRYFVEKLSQPGDVVLDPFCGSGTVLLEARLLGRNAIGIDTNPLARLISSVKARPLPVQKLRRAIVTVERTLKERKHKASVEFPNIDYWFDKKAKGELQRIRGTLDSVRGEMDEEGIRVFLLLCFSSIIRGGPPSLTRGLPRHTSPS